ncbi:hypothetical protein JX265_012166 [Neoarthrinium moseri]|uniref:Defect at low temperature protein 1 n=1 Tax=Neoarthrinium moseri TaxID=1658444 RepID=A0A9Q0AJS4_9PEZI|nr:hypothetical protein JX265_012166 [Neoarthrinium moseri]
MSHHRSSFRRVLHWIYNTVYVLLCLLLAALILITPGDAIRQVFLNTFQYTNIVIIAVAYLVTVLIVLFIYSLRLYVTRTVLAGIPKSWIPIGKGHVKKGVREMIARELGHSAAVAWAARPKVGAVPAADQREALLGVVVEEDSNEVGRAQSAANDEKGTRTSGNWLRPRRTAAATMESEMGIALPPTSPVWGQIEHPGWGSPNSPDLANVQYGAVLAELPNLIEAKAISLAPPAPDSSDVSPVLDPEAVALLQRTTTMSMRTYIGRLIDLGVLESTQNSFEFLDTYERARFLTRPLPAAAFKRLMHLFAELLRSAQPLDRSVVDTMNEMDGMYSDSASRTDIDDDAPQNTSPTTPAQSLPSVRSLKSVSSRGSRRGSSHQASLASSEGSTNAERLRSPLHRPGMATTNSSGNTRGRYGTAPTTPRSKSGRSGTVHSQNQATRSLSRGSSTNSFAQTRQPYVAGSGSSGNSLRSVSGGSVSQGSVIRLARHDDDTSLPYVLRLTESP